MAYVITRSCCNDASCIPVCPVDCIHPRPDEPDFATAEMLYIDPDECIDCGACLEACPVSAIASEDELSDAQLPFAELNAGYFRDYQPLDTVATRAVGKSFSRNGTSGADVRVAVIGAGPAAMYLAEELLTAPGVRVDLFDRLPTPYGLARAGVAPDHQDTKGVLDAFGRIADDPAVRLLLNVEVGTDVSVDQLRGHYHAVIGAFGAAGDRGLDIPGEDLRGSHAATDIVAWYNGHPDFGEAAPDLTGRRAVVIGNGNVALDVARILLTDPEELARTDIADHALQALRNSTIEDVTVVGRRGIAQAAFTTAEMLALDGIGDVEVTAVAEEVHLDPANAAARTDRRLAFNIAAKTEFVETIASRFTAGATRRLHLRFLAAPTEILGSEGWVTGIRFTRMAFTEHSDLAGAVVPTSDEFTTDADLVIRAVGYRGAPVPGLPFDEQTSTVPHDGGRVLDRAGGERVPGCYVTGWIKRGPTGGLGANRQCARETARAVLEDLSAGRLPDPDRGGSDITESLRSNGIAVVDKDGWKRIDRAECESGRNSGRPRVKFVLRENLLAAATSRSHDDGTDG
jgi:ferredoxin--NADP+ reductase